ncbi:hypothetical protein MMC28_009957 [Mycoblastus sanguinarius]|nr:hypothetical protein [Mycoblastus sanguinarius]
MEGKGATLDPEKLAARLREAQQQPPGLRKDHADDPPRSSEASPRSFGTASTLDWEDGAEIRARQAYSTLLEMGGIPSRPIREKSEAIQAYRLLMETGGIPSHLIREDPLQSLIGQQSENPVDSHWHQEWKLFEEELREWEEFRNIQQRYPEDAVRQSAEQIQRIRNHDHHLADIWMKLQEWQDFQAEQEEKIHRENTTVDRTRRTIDMQQLQTTSPDLILSGWKHESKFRDLKDQQLQVEIAEERLGLIKQQVSKIILEVNATTMRSSKLHDLVESELKTQARDIIRSIEIIDGKPSRSIESPPPGQHLLSVLQHWENERAQFQRELQAWKKYLRWYDRVYGKAKFSEQIKHQSTKSLTKTNRPCTAVLWRVFFEYHQGCLRESQGGKDFWAKQISLAEQAMDEKVHHIHEYDRSAIRLQIATEPFREDLKYAQHQLPIASRRLQETERRFEWAKAQYAFISAMDDAMGANAEELRNIQLGYPAETVTAMAIGSVGVQSLPTIVSGNGKRRMDTSGDEERLSVVKQARVCGSDVSFLTHQNMEA